MEALRQQLLVEVYVRQQQCLANLAQLPEDAAKYGIQVVWTGAEWSMLPIQASAPFANWSAMPMSAPANMMTAGYGAPVMAAPTPLLPAPIPVRIDGPLFPVAAPPPAKPTPVAIVAPTPAVVEPAKDDAVTAERLKRLEEIRYGFEEADMQAALRALYRLGNGKEKKPTEALNAAATAEQPKVDEPAPSPVPDEPTPMEVDSKPPTVEAPKVAEPEKPVDSSASASPTDLSRLSGDSAYSSAREGRPKRAAALKVPQFVAKVENITGNRRSSRVAARKQPTKAQIDSWLLKQMQFSPSAWDFTRLDASPMLNSDDKRRFGALYKPKATVKRGKYMLSPNGSTRSIDSGATDRNFESPLSEELWPTEPELETTEHQN